MRDGETERQFIDTAIQSLGELGRNHDGRIGIIALPHIEYARKSVGEFGVAQFFRMNDTILGTAQGENE
jgi:hypothetical protein